MALTDQANRGSLAALIAEAHRRARRRRLRTAMVGGLTVALALAVLAVGSGRGQSPAPPPAAAPPNTPTPTQAAASVLLPANLRVGVPARYNGLITVIQQPDGGVAPTWS